MKHFAQTLLLAMLFVNVAASQGILAPSILKQASATDGQCLTWSSSNSQWEPADCSDSSINIEENNVEVIAAENLTGIDFLGADFDVTDDANEANIAIAAAITRDAEVGALAAAAASVTAGAGAVPKGDASPGRLDISWLASGTPDGSQFVRDDRTLAQVAFSQLTGTASDAQVPDTITLTSIDQAGDVDLTGIADGECLVYDGAVDNRLEPGACGGSINVEENNVEVVAAADLTGIDFLGADFDVTNSANEADVSIAAGITRDSEWDTLAEIEAATGYDFSAASNLTGNVPTAAMSTNVLAAVGGQLATTNCIPYESGGSVGCGAGLVWDGAVATATRVRVGAGTRAAPSLLMTSATNTGWYSLGTAYYEAVADGKGVMAINSGGGINFVSLSANARLGWTANNDDPSVSPNVYFTRSGSGQLSFVASGSTLASFGGVQTVLIQDQGVSGDTLAVFKGGSIESGNLVEFRPNGSDTPNAAITAAGAADFTALSIAGTAKVLPTWQSGTPSNGNCWVYDGVTDNRWEYGACPGGSEVNDLETDGAEGIADTEIYIGTGAGTGNYAAISGDATLANTGALTVVDDSHAHTGATVSDLKATMPGVEIFAADTAVTTGDGKRYIPIPADLNGYVLTGISASVITVGTSSVAEILEIQIARCAVAATGNQCASAVDMLTTLLSIDSGEANSSTAASAVSINTSNDAVATGQVLRVDVDDVHAGTAPNGLFLTFEFEPAP